MMGTPAEAEVQLYHPWSNQQIVPLDAVVPSFLDLLRRQLRLLAHQHGESFGGHVGTSLALLFLFVAHSSQRYSPEPFGDSQSLSGPLDPHPVHVQMDEKSTVVHGGLAQHVLPSWCISPHRTHCLSDIIVIRLQS